MGGGRVKRSSRKGAGEEVTNEVGRMREIFKEWGRVKKSSRKGTG